MCACLVSPIEESSKNCFVKYKVVPKIRDGFLPKTGFFLLSMQTSLSIPLENREMNYDLRYFLDVFSVLRYLL